MHIIYISSFTTHHKGGETGSTGIRKLKLHTEVSSARKTGEINTNADDYAYALAA